MVLYINKIPEGRSVLCQNVEIEEERAEFIPPVKSLNCRAEIERIQTLISVHLFYQGAIILECSRCLREFVFSMHNSLYITLKKDNTHNSKPSAQEEEYDFFFNDTTEEIDIRSPIFDDILLSVPMKPLCFNDCPGIVILPNTAFEMQKNTDVDPRWNGLKKANSIVLSKISGNNNIN
jgi:uncharacterized protein